jgi:uncharacterized protein
MSLLEYIREYNYTFPLKVVPKSSRNRMKLEKDSNNVLQLKIYTTALPEANKANESVKKLLAKELKIAKSRIEIIKGITDRNKVIRIECLD